MVEYALDNGKVLNSYAGKTIHDSFLIQSNGTTPVSIKSLQKGAIIEKVLVRVVRAAVKTPNGGINLTVGDNDSANGFLLAADALATAGTVYGEDPTERGAYLYDATKKGSFSKYYEAEKTLKFVLSGIPDLTEGQYEVIVLGYMATQNPLIVPEE